MIRTKKGGHLVVISGPSGVGKSTVIAEVMHQRDNLVFSVSYTTREPRAGEEDGVSYHFVDKAEFERMIRDGELLEYTQYAGNYYGTALADIQKFSSQGLDVLLDIEVEGASNVKRKADNAVLIFVAPPSFEELSRRLHGRRTENEEVVRARLEKAQVELKQIPNYDYLVVNDSVIRAASDIISILNAEDCRVTKQNLKLEVD
jgi:guanylate kinase